MKRKPLVASVGTAALCIAALWYLAMDGSETPGKPKRGQAFASAQSNTGTALVYNQDHPALTTGFGQALTYQANESFLTPALLPTFEAMLFEVTADKDIRDPATLKKLLVALVPRYFPATLTARATELLERYVDYRVTLSTLKPPADPRDPNNLRTALDARQNARLQHFSGEEYDAMFAEEARLDRYTLARMEIERRSNLTPAQKRAALLDNEYELGQTQRAQRNQATAHLNVAAQTASLNASDATEVDRFAQRRAQYGEAAATQLAQNDKEDRDWQARLNSYANAQAEKASPEQLQRLSEQLFSAQEQLRVEAALAARLLAASPTAQQK